jgi:hypothetical protein
MAERKSEDLNLEPPEYNIKVLLLQQYRYSVTICIYLYTLAFTMTVMLLGQFCTPKSTLDSI